MRPTDGEPRPSVLLIREADRQMFASSCCGRLEGGLFAGEGREGEDCFPERRAVMEAMGPLYRWLRHRYAESVEVTVVDPRNMVSLIPLLLRDFRAHGVGRREALSTFFRLPVTGVVVNGRLLSRGRWPEPEEMRVALGDPPEPWEASFDGAF